MGDEFADIKESAVHICLLFDESGSRGMFEIYVRLIHVDKKSSPLNERSFHLNKKSSHINRKTPHSTGRPPTSTGSYATAIQAANHNRRFIRLYTSLNYSVPATCWRSRTTTNPRKRSSFARLKRMECHQRSNIGIWT